MIVCPQHDWRLITETMYYDETHFDENTQIPDEMLRVGPLGWRRKWYCTRCRVIETSEDPS